MISTTVDLGRPTSGDVIDLIVDDHRLFEQLLRQLRDSTQDRDTVRKAFADVLIAHGEAEEELTILAPARTEVAERVRRDLGEKWAARRNELIDQHSGSISNVRRIVEQAKRAGVLDEE